MCATGCGCSILRPIENPGARSGAGELLLALCRPRPYAFLMPPACLRNRSLIGMRRILRDLKARRISMLDIVFIALGVGILACARRMPVPSAVL